MGAERCKTKSVQEKATAPLLLAPTERGQIVTFQLTCPPVIQSSLLPAREGLGWCRVGRVTRKHRQRGGGTRMCSTPAPRLETDCYPLASTPQRRGLQAPPHLPGSDVQKPVSTESKAANPWVL